MRNALYYKFDGTLQVLEGYYVDDKGYIYKGGKEAKIKHDGAYCFITVKRERKFVHRIVASTFCDVCGDVKEEVHHIDLNPSNNKPDNLLWVTKFEHRSLHRQGLRRIRKLDEKQLDTKKIDSENLHGVIYQYSKQGELVKMWKDLSLIKNYLGDDAYKKIKKYLGTNRSVFGYIWHLG